MKIEILSHKRGNLNYTMFTYCAPNEIVVEFDRLASIGFIPITTSLADDYGRRLTNDGARL